MRLGRILAIGIGCIVTVGASTARAIPVLQLYIEGATYNNTTESWDIAPSSSGPIRLWTIGNVAGDGGHGDITDVRLSIAYEAVALTPTISLTASTTGEPPGGFVDSSAPTRGAGTTGDLGSDWLQTVTDGSIPTLSGGSPLAPHGVFGVGTHWQEFALGDFTLTDSPIADFKDAFPSAPATTEGQINVYEISVVDGAGLTMHVDLYNSIRDGNHAKFAPFSHDGTIVPVPGAAVLAFFGLGLVGFVRKRTP